MIHPGPGHDTRIPPRCPFCREWHRSSDSCPVDPPGDELKRYRVGLEGARGPVIVEAVDAVEATRAARELVPDATGTTYVQLMRGSW